jgi:hypothetical protein
MMVEVTDFKDDPLEKEGWRRRSILDEPRLSEVVKMYQEMGLEVLIVDLDPRLVEGCKNCIEYQPRRYKVVYTRAGEGGGGATEGDGGAFRGETSQ